MDQLSPSMILVIALVAVGVVYLKRKRQRAAERGRFLREFSPDASNDKSLFVRGLSIEVLNKVLTDFVAAYSARLPESFTPLVEPTRDGFVRVTFTQDMPSAVFAFLVNYAQYPNGVDLKTHQIESYGTVTLTAAFPVPDAALIGRMATFYVPTEDDEFDVVFIRAGADFYEWSFASDKWEQTTDARLPGFVGAAG